jgi:hypothetical protein
MGVRDSVLFEQPLNFVHQIDEGKHIVLFYEELEYAKMISFQFIKSGLVHKKDCSYLSEEEVESVKREMSDSGIDVKKLTQNNQLNIYQVSSLTDYPSDILIKEEGESPASTLLNNPSKVGQTDRIVLRCIYKVESEEQKVKLKMGI